MTYRKMTDADVRRITKFIDECAESVGGLTWKAIEENSKFTRQALQAHALIKESYLQAKQKISEARKPKLPEERILTLAAPEVAEEIVRLRKRIEILEHREELWRRRWYCIAYHIRKEGVQMSDIDKPVPLGSIPLTAKNVRDTLDPFDKDVPPVARRRDN